MKCFLVVGGAQNPAHTSLYCLNLLRLGGGLSPQHNPDCPDTEEQSHVDSERQLL